ncbi:antiviral innate immune response receptor RIG-I-like [Saccoglossus kowalevskii]
MDCVRETDVHLANYIEGIGSIDNLDDLNHFKQLVMVYSHQLQDINPMEILPELASVFSDTDKENIEAEQRNFGARQASMVMCCRLVQKGGHWFHKFIDALDKVGHAEIAEDLRKSIIHKGEDGDGHLKGKKAESDTATHTVSFSSEGENKDLESEYVNDDVLDGNGDIHNNDDGDNNVIEKYDKEGTEKCGATKKTGKDGFNNETSSDAMTVKLRKYQHELVQPALEGRNTIICAPTGCGKTITALYIMKRHLEKKFTGQRPNKIVFLVNQRPLVEQQGGVFRDYLEPLKYNVMQLTGDTFTIPLEEVVRMDYHIIVLTAQVLENALRDKVLSSLSVFTMLVFDECHHTQKKEPYNNIMARYRDMKLDKPEAPRPQIIGLSASLGVGKARLHSGAIKHIIKLCANLDAEKISTVVKEKNELMKYVPIPHEDRLSVKGRTEDPFVRQINIIMSRIEEIMKTSQGRDITPRLLNPPTIRGTQSYEKWVIDIKKDSAEVIHDPQKSRMFATCAAQLREYNNALFINEDVRTLDALRYLQKYFKSLEDRQEGFDQLDKDLVQLFQDKQPQLEIIAADPSFSNPLLEKLGSLIQLAYQENDSSQAIVLTKTRAACYALQSWMEETDELKHLNPGVLIGSGGSGENPGLTQSEQTNILEMFKDGCHRIIICTSVAQEGIDIASCNLVFRYNYSNNEIGRIQSKGRSRAKDGKTFLVAGDKTGIAAREQLNMIRENMMYRAISEVKQMPNSEFDNRIIANQKDDQTERRYLAAAEASSKSKLERQTPENAIKFLCGRCMEFACLSSDFRQLKQNHHVVVDEKFKTRITIKPHAKPKQIDDLFLKDGKVYCKKCMHDWGIMAKIRFTHYPILKISSFVMEMPSGGRKVRAKWKDAPFAIEHCRERELEKEINTLPDHMNTFTSTEINAERERDILVRELKNIRAYNIKGTISINGQEFVIGQYADDTLFLAPLSSKMG